MDSIFKNRILELAERSYRNGIYTFSDFLGISEISDLKSLEGEISYAGVTLYGGFENADRQMARFGSKENLGYEESFPISCVIISPVMSKFADNLTHRDFLGAIMNLGIDRSTVGDIKVSDKEALVFLHNSMTDYVKDNLNKVKHTTVKIRVIDDINQVINLYKNEEPASKNIVTSSLRIDGIISKVYNISRNDSLELFRNQKIFLNGRLIENNSMAVKAGDVINARGYGKFRIEDEPGETRKGRISIRIAIW